MINNLLGGIFGKVVENASSILDEVITTDEERDKAKLELEKVLLSVYEGRADNCFLLSYF